MCGLGEQYEMGLVRSGDSSSASHEQTVFQRDINIIINMGVLDFNMYSKTWPLVGYKLMVPQNILFCPATVHWGSLTSMCATTSHAMSTAYTVGQCREERRRSTWSLVLSFRIMYFFAEMTCVYMLVYLHNSCIYVHIICCTLLGKYTWWLQFLKTFPPVQAGATSNTWHSLFPWNTNECNFSKRTSICGCMNITFSINFGWKYKCYSPLLHSVQLEYQLFDKCLSTQVHWHSQPSEEDFLDNQ